MAGQYDNDAWGGSWGESWGESWFRLFDNAWPRQPVAGRKRSRRASAPAVLADANVVKPPVKPKRVARASPAADFEDIDPKTAKKLSAARSERAATEAREGEERRRRAIKAAEEPAKQVMPPVATPAQETAAVVELPAVDEVADINEVVALILEQDRAMVMAVLQELADAGELDELPLAA